MSKPTSFDTTPPAGAEADPNAVTELPRAEQRGRPKARQDPAGPRRRTSPKDKSGKAGTDTAKTGADTAPPPQQDEGAAPVPPPAGPARRKRRHVGLVVTFLLAVVLPAAMATGYLYFFAADQYASRVGFAVRTEEVTSPAQLLGGLTQISGGSSKDTDILYEFIRSQQLVQKLDEKLDLRSIYSGPHERDPVFAFSPDATLEDLVDYWSRMVKVVYDSGTGLIEVRVLAFSAEEAQTVAQAIYEESSSLVNELSTIARRDALRYARQDLGEAENRLRNAREALTEFRNRNQIVDPKADIQGQMGLLTSLQQKLATAQVDLQLLRETAREDDPRIRQTERRIEVIRSQIEKQRQKFSVGGAAQGAQDGEDYVEMLGDYERLSVDREFAREAYVAARSSYDSARAKADRQTRYLAAYIEPTKAQTSRYPQRLTLAGLAILFLFLVWAIGALIFYSIRDRR